MIYALTLSLLLAGAPNPELAAGPEPLVAAALELGLAKDPAWLRLGHYRPRRVGGYESDADGPAFFLSPTGKRDPEAELEATLRAFFAPPTTTPDAQHPQCQFPARRAWLVKRLGLKPAQLPLPPECPRFQEFWERVQAVSVTMVFSSYYLGNPASAFGHNLLRLNKAESARSGKRFELIDYGVDYSATVDTNNPVVYAFKGLTGQFRGSFNHYPYFYKVREYGDYESRDLWEYDLELTSEEVAMLVGHLWELGSTWFDYYYLTENCSYGVLSALEAAAPRLDLLSHVGPLVIPADSIKALFRNPGLVRDVHFRPSIRTQFTNRYEALSSEERDAVFRLVDAPAEALRRPLSPEREARALDAALDYVDYVNAREIMDNVETPAATLKQQLMVRRANLGVQSAEQSVPIPQSERPELGHGAMRFGLSGGASRKQGVLVFDFRAGMHDLGDLPDGYPSHYLMEFLPLRLRYEAGANSPELDEFLLANFVVLNDFGAYGHAPTLKAKVGVTTVRDAGCASCRVVDGEIGAGISKAFRGSSVSWLPFVTADVQLLAGPKLQGTGGSALRVGVGPAVGMSFWVGKKLSTVAMGSLYYLPASSPSTTHSLSLTTRFHMAPCSLSLELRGAPYEKLMLLGVSTYY